MSVTELNGTYTIDPSHSRLGFSTRHAMVTKVRGAFNEVTAPDADTLRVTGDLTIKDVTRPVTVDFDYAGTAQDPFGNDRIGFEGSTVVNRKDFGLTWNAALETGGVLVSEKATLEFEISLIKAA